MNIVYVILYLIIATIIGIIMANIELKAHAFKNWEEAKGHYEPSLFVILSALVWPITLVALIYWYLIFIPLWKLICILFEH